jgi:hypothetical protein
MELGPRIEQEEYEDEDEDLGICPYYARYYAIKGYDGNAVCSFGCSDEPQCITCEPLEGWPSNRVGRLNARS